MDLGRPSRHVAEDIHGRRHVDRQRMMYRLAIVIAFKKGQFLRILLDLARDRFDDPAPIQRPHARPCGGLERGPRALHGPIHILCGARRHIGEYLSGRRVLDIDSAPIRRLFPVATDQHAGRGQANLMPDVTVKAIGGEHGCIHLLFSNNQEGAAPPFMARPRGERSKTRRQIDPESARATCEADRGVGDARGVSPVIGVAKISNEGADLVALVVE